MVSNFHWGSGILWINEGCSNEPNLLRRTRACITRIKVGDGNFPILKVFAQKFLDDENTRDEITRAIDQHNEKFNKGGEFLVADQDQRIVFYKISDSTCF